MHTTFIPADADTLPEITDIGEVRANLVEAERRIADLKLERDEALDLVQRMKEHVEDATATIDQWKEAFDMQLSNDGIWEWKIDDVIDAMHGKYSALLKEWNRFVPQYNAAVAPKQIGRPLDASPAQCARVLKLKKAGKSFRVIAEETSLSLQTVRTIVGRQTRTDRTSINRLQKLDPENAAVSAFKARKRVRDALPKRISKTLDQGAALVKEAKGLGR